MPISRYRQRRILRGAALGLTGGALGWVLARVTGFEADRVLLLVYLVVMVAIGAIMGWRRP